MDYAGELDTNFIIVVNDNQMSIAENHGGLYRNLQELRESQGTCPCNFFKAMGLDYLYVDQGNDIGSLISAFQKVKDIDHPVVVHINTLKGKGYRPAEEHKEPWHYCAPFDIATGEPKHKSDDGEDYGTLTADYLLAKMKEDRRVVGITAGTPTIMGFTEDRRLGSRTAVRGRGYRRGTRPSLWLPVSLRLEENRYSAYAARSSNGLTTNFRKTSASTTTRPRYSSSGARSRP